MIRFSVLLFGFGLAGSASLYGHAQHPHVHGQSVFQLVQEEKELKLEWTVSASDLLGFERIPETAQEKGQFKALESRLSQTEKLFKFTERAQCEPQSKPEVTPRDLGGGHLDLIILWSFECSRPRGLRWIEVYAAREFPAVETYRVDLITERGHARQRLGESRTRVHLPR